MVSFHERKGSARAAPGLGITCCLYTLFVAAAHGSRRPSWDTATVRFAGRLPGRPVATLLTSRAPPRRRAQHLWSHCRRRRLRRSTEVEMAQSSGPHRLRQLHRAPQVRCCRALVHSQLTASLAAATLLTHLVATAVDGCLARDVTAGATVAAEAASGSDSRVAAAAMEARLSSALNSARLSRRSGRWSAYSCHKSA